MMLDIVMRSAVLSQELQYARFTAPQRGSVSVAEFI
jgi:hypothetical protein